MSTMVYLARVCNLSTGKNRYLGGKGGMEMMDMNIIGTSPLYGSALTFLFLDMPGEHRKSSADLCTLSIRRVSLYSKDNSKNHQEDNSGVRTCLLMRAP